MKNFANFGLLSNNPIHGIAGTLGAATGIVGAVRDADDEYEQQRRHIMTRVSDPYERERQLNELDSIGNRAKRFGKTAERAAIRGAVTGAGAWGGSHLLGQVFGGGRKKAPVQQG